MPVQVSYPGVYIEELPSGVFTITGVATSITAFVGLAERGPVNTAYIINSYSDYDRIFGGLWQPSTMSFAVNDFYANGGAQAVIVRLTSSTPGKQAVAAWISLSEDMTLSGSGSPPAHGGLPPDGFANLTLVAANPGAWGNDLSVAVDHVTKDPTDLSLFNLTLTLKDPTLTTTLASEKYLNVSVDPTSSRYVVTTLLQNSNLANVQATGAGVAMVPPSRPADTTLSGSPPHPPFFKGGEDGGPLTSNDFIGPGTEANKTGLYTLQNTDLFNILCIPPYTASEDIDATVASAAADYCKSRRAMYLLDPPSSWTNLQAALTNFPNNPFNIGSGSSDAVAMYFPRIIEPNPLLDNQLDTFVPCGVMAGIYARTDTQRGVWKAPAGQDAGMSGVSQLAVPLTDAENGQLNPLGLNCLRSFPIVGRVAWGARTLQGADALESQWKYVPIRRLAFYIEESLYRGTKFAVFEPNDETLWSNLRLSVGSFMHDLFRQGAFFGTSPDQAYFVKCDGETTTQNDIDSGIVNIVVGFAPLYPAEFVIIQIQQISGQLQV
jgi:phage tail sheath protein FI